MDKLKTDFFKKLFKDFNLSSSEIHNLENNINVIKSHLEILKKIDINQR